MPGLEQHRQHLAPQVARGHPLVQLELAAIGLGLVGGVGGLEVGAEPVVQVGACRRREQRPLATFHHPLHEQVGDPVGGVHVMRAPPVVAGVLAQLEELLDVEVPAFQVGAHRALALATLVDRHGRVVDDLQKRHHTLTLAVGALDVRAQRAHRRPVVAQAAGIFGQQRVLFQRLVNAVEVIGHGGQVATRQLGAQGAGVEQGGRARHEIEARQHVVELDRPRFAVDLLQRQTHCHAHEERLWQLDALLADVQEVAVVQRLQTQVVELQVALGLERRTQPRQIELLERRIHQLGRDATRDELWKVLGVAVSHGGLRHLSPDHLLADGVQQQPRSGMRVRRLLLEQRARGQDRCLVDLVDRHAVIQVAPRLGEDRLCPHIGAKARARRLDQRLQRRHVEWHPLTVVGDVQCRLARRGLLHLLGALLRTTLAIEHVGTRHLVVAAAHQAELDLVLHVFDVEGAPTGTRAQQRAHDGLGERVDGFTHAGGGGALRPVHRKECLHQRDRDLVRLEHDHGAVAPDDLVARVRRFGGDDGRDGVQLRCRVGSAGGH